MKKILLLTIALLAMFVMSCSNDDIEITKVNPKHDITLNISTQSMYDEFGITSGVRDNYLRDGGRVIGVTTFVYDSNGNLIDSQMTPQSTFNNVAQTFKDLVEDSYTLVTVETLLNPDDGYKAEDWSFDDSDKLSTLKITQVNSNVYYGGVLGVVTTIVNLKSDVSQNATPKAIGSLVKYHPYDLEESEYAYFCFVTNDILKYYSLNPQIQGKEKFNEDLTKKNYVNLRCLANTENSTGYYWTFYILESSIEWMNGAMTETQAKNGNLSTWQSQKVDLEDGKTYDAGFYYLLSEGDVTYAASYFGDASGLNSWASEWESWKKKNVNTQAFAVPYTDWTVGTVSAVRSYMNSFTLYQDIQYDESSKKYEMVYIDTSNHNTIYEYSFTSSTSGLTDAYVILDGSNYTIDQVLEAVEKQGYTLSSQVDGGYFYRNETKTTSVYIYKLTSGYIVVNYYNPQAYSAAPKHEMPVDNVDTKSLSRADARLSGSLSSTGVLPIAPFANKEMRKILNN